MGNRENSQKNRDITRLKSAPMIRAGRATELEVKERNDKMDY